MATGVVILVRTEQEISDEDLKCLRHKFIKEMNLSDEDFYNSSKDNALVKVSSKDFEIIPANETSWLNVNFWKAYYDVGYERGDIKLYVESANWLKENLPDCQIYYGHDSNDENIHLFDNATRLLFQKQEPKNHVGTL